jgi:hypothetical protein
MSPLVEYFILSWPLWMAVAALVGLVSYACGYAQGRKGR